MRGSRERKQRVRKIKPLEIAILRGVDLQTVLKMEVYWPGQRFEGSRQIYMIFAEQI